MGSHICYTQDLQTSQNLKLKLKKHKLNTPTSKINVNYNIKYQYNNYVQNNSIHIKSNSNSNSNSNKYAKNNNNNPKQQQEQSDFEQINKVLILEENLMKDDYIQSDQLQYLIVEYQKMIEELDRQNNPIKDYFIQKMQNVMSQGVIKKQNVELGQTIEIDNYQSSVLEGYQSSVLAQIEQKIEKKQIKKVLFIFIKGLFILDSGEKDQLG